MFDTYPVPVHELMERDVLVEPAGVANWTELFRESSMLQEAYHAAVDRLSDHSVLRVNSAACSIFAEGDSILAIANKAKDVGRVAITGVDIDPFAVNAAKTAKYASRWTAKSVAERQRNMLLDFGFDIFQEEERGKRLIEMRFLIDSSGVREGHDIDIYQHNIATELPERSQGADLILVNNVLYYFSEIGAINIVSKLASALGPTGVLSMGDNARHVQMGRNSLHGLQYDLWQEQAEEILANEFNMVPIIAGKKTGKGVVFAKQE